MFFITASYKDEKYLASKVDYAIMQKRKRDQKFAIVTLRYPDAAPRRLCRRPARRLPHPLRPCGHLPLEFGIDPDPSDAPALRLDPHLRRARGAIHRDLVPHVRRLDRPAVNPLVRPAGAGKQHRCPCRTGRRRHEHRVGAPLRTLRLLSHDPAPLLRLRDPLPRGERVPVELAVDDIRQRHHPERPDIAHHALDPIRKRPARLSRVELSSMAAPVNVPIAPRVPFLFVVPTVPEVPFGNRRFRGAVHVEIHRFGPTGAAMMVAIPRPSVTRSNCPLWTYMECEIPPAPISHNSGLAFRTIRLRSARYV